MEKQEFIDIGQAKVDITRQSRNGYPEIIFGQGKTAEQIIEIMQVLHENGQNALATRVDKHKAKTIKKILPSVIYDDCSQCAFLGEFEEKTKDYICVVTAGTSDLPVAKEAVFCARVFGNKVEEVYDVGVAGLHRLLAKLDVIRNAKVVIVVAGMEGALTSVVGGLVNKPVIAVPTSVGYGASFNGMAALLSMLNSCASGVSVVNINNGFGAAYNASMINQL